ncbi:unnamed protein product, partial [Allacma fusca]
CTSVQDVESCAEVPVPSKSNDLCGRTSRDSVKYPHKISSEDSVESREESPLLPEARPKVDDLTFSTLSTGSTTLNKIEVNTQGTPLTRVERLPCGFRQTPLKFAEDFTQKFLEEFRRFEKTILNIKARCLSNRNSNWKRFVPSSRGGNTEVITSTAETAS